MKIRVYPRVRYLDFPVLAAAYVPTKKRPEFDREKWSQVEWEYFAAYLRSWYPAVFTFYDGYAEADEDMSLARNSQWYEWHIQRSIDHQVWDEAQEKWVNGVKD